MFYIAFDYLSVQPTTFSPYHGGGKYGKIILKELLTRVSSIILFYSEKLPHTELDSLQKKYPEIILANLDKSETWDKVFSTYKISCIYLPIPFSRLYKQFSNKFPKNIRVVGTIHGLRNLEAIPTLDSFKYRVPFKGFLRTIMEYIKSRIPGSLDKIKKEWKKLVERKNYEYFVVSYHTQKAIKNFLPNQNPKVFYSPSVIEKRNYNEVREPYFLLVSGNRWEKNNLIAIRVLDELFSEKKISENFFVIITGVKDLTSFRYKIKNPTRFKCVGYVPEDNFPLLYTKAFAFIYPSLSEGFGYPILEALAVETPTIASKLTSIPEIGGNAVLYFDPLCQKDIEKKILALFDKKIYKSLVNESLTQFNHIYRRQKLDLKKAVDFILNSK